MKKYIGTFKNADDSITTVVIMPSNGIYDEEQEIIFPFDEPVIITQESDGIFTPVKTKSCTIKIFTEEIYWELYTANPTEWFVKVDTQQGTNYPLNLFTGYLTPCIFSQDYAYNGIIELEAVDCLAVLGSIKYKLYNTNEGKQILDCGDIVFRNIFEKNLPNYSYRLLFYTDDSIYKEDESGDIYISGYYSSDDNILYKYKLQESNFFNDENEPMNCKDIIEEICKYLGISMMMYNGSIVLIDYNHLINLPHTESNLLPSKYGGGTPTIELDDVYSKIGINCDLYEVNDLIYDIYDDEHSKELVNAVKLRYSKNGDSNPIYSNYGYEFSTNKWFFIKKTKDSDKSKILIKPYYLVDSNFANLNKGYKTGYWKSKVYLASNGNTATELGTTTPIKIDTRIINDFLVDGDGIAQWKPIYNTVIPSRMYAYNEEDGISDTVNWDEILVIPVMNRTYYNDKILPNNTYHDSKNTEIDKITYNGDDLEREILSFESDEFIPYSIQEGISWLVFNANIWYQRNYTHYNFPNFTDTNDVDVWGSDLTRCGCTFPFDKITYNKKDCTDRLRNCFEHDKDSELHNQGWEMLKCKLQIGDKYFQGFEWDSTKKKFVSKGWSTTPTTFYFRFHNEKVSKNETEYLSTFKWLSPVSTTNYEDKVQTDGFAIPIREEDKVSGKLTFTLYTPRQVCVNPESITDTTAQTFTAEWYNNCKVTPNNGYMYFCPTIFMKDFSLNYEYTDNKNWADDVQVQDDIVYETVVDNTYLESDDTTLKINSWYENKPISRSYVLDSDNLPIKNTYHIDINEETGLYKQSTYDGSSFWECIKTPQEAYLLTKYYAHYHKPKKILNLNYNTLQVKPFELYNHQSTNTKYFADSYTLDVRKAQSQIKFIEL